MIPNYILRVLDSTCA